MPVLGWKLQSPEYTAVIVCDPTVNADVFIVATPTLKATGAPTGVPLSRNCTVPLGVPAPGATALTVAVKVTACPTTDGLTDEVTAVVVLALITVWMTLPALARKLPSPEYCAVIVYIGSAHV